MPKYVTKVRTEEGDLQIDYNALANLPKSDTTLSQSGSFADAKAVGDAVSNVMNSAVQLSSVANNLTTDEEGYVLDARQGKVLQDSKVNISDIVDDLTTGGASKVLSAEQGVQLKSMVDEKVKTADIVDNLDSTNTSVPLSANQGRILKNMINAGVSVATRSVNLTSAGWTDTTAPYDRTITISEVTADNIVIVTPSYESQDEYYACGVGASAQGAGTLTFTAQIKPSVAMTVNILVINRGVHITEG